MKKIAVHRRNLTGEERVRAKRRGKNKGSLEDRIEDLEKIVAKLEKIINRKGV